MPKDAAVEEFAGLVRALKARDGRSYEALGRRLGVSASTLHRSCSGATVLEEFAVVDRLRPHVRGGRGGAAGPGGGLGGGGSRPPPSGLTRPRLCRPCRPRRNRTRNRRHRCRSARPPHPATCLEPARPT
ncbi:helix-turn-helix transcriptional regulator [Streptomyces sp. NPDC026589]|uniref:helix-turn-helix domain-containing protein n=1 Tax=Streptomyces sp. NPDC026589 TaxID=3155609 RepID=UPI003411A5F4